MGRVLELQVSGQGVVVVAHHPDRRRRWKHRHPLAAGSCRFHGVVDARSLFVSAPRVPPAISFPELLDCKVSTINIRSESLGDYL